jgi:hypothetical protein
METTHHLVSACGHTQRVWSIIAYWIGLSELKPTECPHSESALRTLVEEHRTPTEHPKEGRTLHHAPNCLGG